MRVVQIPKEGSRYQVIFTSMEEAVKDAREQSEKLNRRLFIVCSRGLFYVDSNDALRDWEVLHAIFENGNLVGHINELIQAAFARSN